MIYRCHDMELRTLYIIIVLSQVAWLFLVKVVRTRNENSILHISFVLHVATPWHRHHANDRGFYRCVPNTACDS